MKAHIETEAYLEEIAKANMNKFTYTAIREGLYSESFPIYTAWFDPKNPADEITIPHDGSGPGVAWVKRDELAEATAKLIFQYAKDPEAFPYLNKTIFFSGSRAITLAETVEILGRVIGKPLRIRQISVEEYAALPQVGNRHTYKGVNLSKEWTTAWDAIRRGETAVIDPLLGQVLGREPEDFETTVRKLISA